MQSDKAVSVLRTALYTALLTFSIGATVCGGMLVVLERGLSAPFKSGIPVICTGFLGLWIALVPRSMWAQRRVRFYLHLPVLVALVAIVITIAGFSALGIVTAMVVILCYIWVLRGVIQKEEMRGS